MSLRQRLIVFMFIWSSVPLTSMQPSSGMKELIDPKMTSVLRLCLSHALELVFFKSTEIGGKPRKCWSQVGVEQTIQC